MTPDLGPAKAVMRRGVVMTVLGLIGVAVVMVIAIRFTPEEARQGMAQKILYMHVPSATVTLYIAVPLTGLFSVLYLWLRDLRFDRLAAVTAEVASIFCLAVLSTGPIWARPIWGAWWTWDGRLTLTLFLFFLLLGYHTLRASVRDPVERGRLSAVVSVMGVILVPFIHLSVYLWRGLHPMPILLKPSAPSMPWEMTRTLLTGIGVFIFMFIGMVTLRYGIQLARDVREAADAA
jgi:heme exporter protein C